MDNTIPDVKQEIANSSPATPDPVVVADKPKEQEVPKGFVPYQALKEERDARKALEEKLEKLSVPSEATGEVYSDEGKLLKSEISGLRDELKSIKRNEDRREAEIEFPFLKDKKQEFDTFLEDEENKRLSIRKAAKLFAAEQGLAQEPQRKGLEKPSGGIHQPPEAGLTNEEVAYLMKNNWKQYEKLLKEGKIV